MTDHDEALRLALASDADCTPPAGIAMRVLAAAAPLLDENTRRSRRRRIARAIFAAVAPLPLILVVDAYLVRVGYALLATLLPSTLSLWLLGNYVAFLALLLALTYGAVPILAAGPGALRHEARHV